MPFFFWMPRQYQIRAGKLSFRDKYHIRLKIMRSLNFSKDHSDCYFRRTTNEVDIIDL